MIVNSRNTQRGATIVFVLMALIALLAIAVVFLSRLTQKDMNHGSPAPVVLPVVLPADATAGTAPIITTASTTTESTGLITETPVSEPETSTAPEIVIPPPPPPLLPQVTPDPKSLPPEG